MKELNKEKIKKIEPQMLNSICCRTCETNTLVVFNCSNKQQTSNRQSYNNQQAATTLQLETF